MKSKTLVKMCKIYSNLLSSDSWLVLLVSGIQLLILDVTIYVLYYLSITARVYMRIKFKYS